MSLHSRNCSNEFEDFEVEGKKCRGRWFCKDKFSARNSRHSLLATIHESLLWNGFISRWSRDSFIVLPDFANNKSIAFAGSQRWYTLGVEQRSQCIQTTRCGRGWFVRFSRAISAHQGRWTPLRICTTASGFNLNCPFSSRNKRLLSNLRVNTKRHLG